MSDEHDTTLKLEPGEVAEVPGEESPSPIYPLGLPKGSVRAMTALLIFLVTCLLILTGREVPVELRMTLILTLSYYFASRRRMTGTAEKARKEASPLWLPRGSMRLFFIVGFGLLLFLAFRKSGLDFGEPVWSKNLSTIALIGAFLFGSLLRPVLDRLLKVMGEQATAVVLGGHIRGMIALLTAIGYSLAVLFSQLGELPDAADKIFLFVVGFYYGNRN